MTGMLHVQNAPMAQITDLGRLRGPRFGLPTNGALDQYSARVANILVGNSELDPLIEVTAFDARFTVTSDALISVTGAEVQILVDEVERPSWEPVSLRAGQTVSLCNIRSGLRCYLAVHGSFDVPYLLGSCAPDTGVGFGSPLHESSSITLRRSTDVPVSDFWGESLFNLQVLRPEVGGTAVVDVINGPDIAEFSGTADRLFSEPYVVSPKSNHVGLRLHGAPLPVRTSTEEKISRGVPIGAVEVPPGDELLILHRGRGVTAGYPVLGVVTTTSLDTLGQVRPGQEVKLRTVDIARARDDTRAWRAELTSLREKTAMAFSSLGLSQHLQPTAPRSGATLKDDEPATGL